MNGMDDAAKNYLEVAKVALAATNDTTVTIPAAAASIDGLMAAVNNVAKKQEAASEAAAKKVADEKLVQGLAKAKEACDKIAEADRPDNVDCKKVAAGESAAKQGQGKPAPSG
ncbi:hypothetical protein ASE95_16425 [Sphingomonas sp. Leaf231]|nr:hypothetical protein ASE95_16425 [Sphingomonas sp. Leaf231]